MSLETSKGGSSNMMSPSYFEGRRGTCITESSSKFCMARSPCEPLQSKSRTNSSRDTGSGNSIGDSMIGSTTMSGHSERPGSTLAPKNDKVESGSTITRECRLEVLDLGYRVQLEEQTSKTQLRGLKPRIPGQSSFTA
jgi:hypothetical protein